MDTNVKWTVQPPKGMLKGEYHRIEKRFKPYYPGVEGQFPADPGHLGIVEVVKDGGKVIFVELNEITSPTYYRHIYRDISKRRSDFSFWELTKDRMKELGVNITMGFQHLERQMLEEQRLSGQFDLLTGASGSAKQIIKVAAELEQAMGAPSGQTLYSYSEDYGYGLTGWLKVVVREGEIISCRFDEVFADAPDDIVHPQLKQYYRQSKYDCQLYEDPYPTGWDRHAFLAGFCAQMDNLEKKVLATQDLLDVTGLPHTTGVDLGVIWDKVPDRSVELSMAERPVYPAWKNYARMAPVVLREMKADGVL